MGVQKRVKCTQKHEDCFAYRNNYCRVLDSGAFDRECPYYKPKEKYDADLRLYPMIDYSDKQVRKGKRRD